MRYHAAMGSTYKGDLSTKAGRRRAWLHGFFADHAFFRIFWTNFAAVKPGVLYRANQPTPANLRVLTRKYGLNTLINLRGQTKYGSAALSRLTAQELGLDFYDMAFESRGAPHRDRILRLAEIFANMRSPALIHCKSGADRAGLAAGLFLLLEGGTVEQALKQLSLRFGHIRQSKTGILDAFFQLYQRTGEGRKPFLDWVREDYDEDALRAAFKAGKVAEFINAKVLGRE
jgi:protein tyrosine/serine phosphatase